MMKRKIQSLFLLVLTICFTVGASKCTPTEVNTRANASHNNHPIITADETTAAEVRDGNCKPCERIEDMIRNAESRQQNSPHACPMYFYREYVHDYAQCTLPDNSIGQAAVIYVCEAPRDEIKFQSGICMADLSKEICIFDRESLCAPAPGNIPQTQ